MPSPPMRLRETVRFLRTPGGAVNSRIREEAKKLGLSVLFWSVDPRDWESRDREKIVEAVLTAVQPGSIVLLHDIYPASVEAALEIVDVLQEKGYWFVTVKELLQLGGVQPQAGVMYRKG